MTRWPWPLRSAIGLVVGAATGFAVTVATAAAGAGVHNLYMAMRSVLAGIAVATAVSAAAIMLACWPGHKRRAAAAVTALTFGAGSVLAVGPDNVSAMSLGVQAGCQFGMGRCVATMRATFPLLVSDGPIQTKPVVHVILWGANGAERAEVLSEERRTAGLGQPLLNRFYDVGAGRDGGSWQAPSDPASWLKAHHLSRIPVSQLAALIDVAQRTRHWSDSTDTQWWIATDLDAAQLDIPAPGCGDHLHARAVKGAIVRLPLADCATPDRQAPSRPGGICSPLASVAPSGIQPQSTQAGIDLIIDHEYAEAATDPAGGWHLLVADQCQGYVLTEIADVCEVNGPFIAAPSYDTAAGWQPSLLRPGRPGSAASCVDPAAPGR